MHDKALLVYNTKDHSSMDEHGIYAEPNAWYYLQKNMGHPMDKTQFTKHYISDMKSGYTMTEFVDDDIAKTKKRFNHNMLLGLILTDVHNNPYKNKKQYDIGGLVRYEKILGDRTTLKYFKKIANKGTHKEREKVAAQLSERVKNPRTPHRDKIIAALDYYNSFSRWHWLRTSDNVPVKLIW